MLIQAILVLAGLAMLFLGLSLFVNWRIRRTLSNMSMHYTGKPLPTGFPSTRDQLFHLYRWAKRSRNAEALRKFKRLRWWLRRGMDALVVAVFLAGLTLLGLLFAALRAAIKYL